MSKHKTANGRMRVYSVPRGRAGRADRLAIGRCELTWDKFHDVKQALDKWLMLHDPAFKAGTYHY